MLKRPKPKQVFALFLSVAVVLSSAYIGSLAGSVNLLANLTLSSTPDGYSINAATNSLTVATANEHQVFFNGLTLDAAKSYSYEFTLNFNDVANSESVRIPVRFNNDWSNGHFVYVGLGTYQQLRVNTDYWTNASNLAVKTSMGYQSGVDYAYKIITTPTSMQIYIDGVLQVENTNLPAIGGQIGIASNNAKFTMKNISLKEVTSSADAINQVIQKIDAIGTVNAYSKEAITAARTDYAALTSAEQAQVTNLSKLTAAESAFAVLNKMANLTLSATPDGYTVNAATNSLTVATTAEHLVYFNGLTLDATKTYVYEFTLNYDNVSGESIRIPVRFAGDYNNAHFVYISFGLNQLRVNTDYWSNAGNLAVKTGMGYAAGVDYAFKIITTPTSMQIYVDGVLMVENTNLPAIGGQIGIASNNATFKMKNISLTEVVADTSAQDAVIQKINDIGTVNATSKEAITAARTAYAALTTAQQAQVTNLTTLTAAESAFAALNKLANLTLNVTPDGYTVDAAANSLTVATTAENQVYFNNLTLDATKTYYYEFTLNYDSISGGSVLIPVRFNGDFSNGHFVQNNFSLNQLRVNTDYWTNSPNLAVKGSMGYAAGVDYAFKIIAAPTSMQIYINGVLQVENTKLSAIGGQIGIATNNASYKMKNISLTEVVVDTSAVDAVIQKITDIGTVGATSKEAITAARTAYAALTTAQQAQVTNLATLTAAETTFAGLNKMANLALNVTPDGYSVDAATNSLTVATTSENYVFFNNLTLDATKTYYYEFTLNYDSISGESVRIPVRYSGDFTNGHFVYINFSLNQLRVNTDYWTNAANLAVKGSMGYTAGVDYAFKIITTPTSMKIYINGVLQVENTNLSAIGGQIGIASNNASFKMKNISLTEVGAVVNPPDPGTPAEVETHDIDFYSLSASNKMGYNYWPSALAVSNTSGGGIHFKWENAGTNMRVGVKRGVPLDGLHAVFSNVTFTSTSKKMAFFLANYDNAEDYTQFLNYNGVNYLPLAIVLDADLGTVSIMYHGDSGTKEDVIITNNALKYSQIGSSEWSMKINAAGNGNYTLEVAGCTGVITKAMMDRLNKLTDVESVFFTLCPWGSGVSTEMDFLSLHGKYDGCADLLTDSEVEAVKSVITLISNLGTITKDSGTAISEAETAYAALTANQKAVVTNYAILRIARERYDNLAKAYKDTAYYAPSTDDLMGINH